MNVKVFAVNSHESAEGFEQRIKNWLDEVGDIEILHFRQSMSEHRLMATIFYKELK